MSISSLYSNLTPTLIVDPRNSRRLDPRFTFSRASSATYVNRQKVITTAKSNEPFVEWDPATGSCLGLRLWGSTTNLLLRSEEFTSAAWTLFGAATRSADATTSPANTLTADSVTLPAGAGIYQPIAASSNTSYTFSIWIRANSAQSIRVTINTNLSDPVSTSINATTAWQRVSVSKTTSAGTTSLSAQLDTGNGNTFFIWGAQLQTGSTVGPYVPTGAATVSTSAATLSLTGTEFARIWNTGGLGIYAEVIAAQASNGSNQFIARASDGSYNNAMALNVTGSGFLQSAITANGTLYSIGSSSALVSGNVIKTATRINTNDLSLAHVNSTFTNNVATLPTSLNRLDIGADHLGLNAMVGMYLRRLCVYPRGLTNSQMLQLIRG